MLVSLDVRLGVRYQMKKGLASMVVPLYLAEAARSKERGFLVTLNVMFITGGQAVAAVFAGALATVPEGWR